MALDLHPNAVFGLLASPITDSATTITLEDASSFPDPGTGGYNCPISNPLLGHPAEDPNYEIVRVTNVAGDVLTVTRAQEGTTASPHSAGDAIYRAPTKKDFDDIEGFHQLVYGPWMASAITASQASTAMRYSDNTLATTCMATPFTAGSVRGISARYESPVTAGEIELELFIGGSSTGFVVKLNTSEPNRDVTLAAKGVHTFTAKQSLRLNYSTNAALAPTAKDLVGEILVQPD